MSDLTPILPSPIEGEGDWSRALAAFRAAQAAVLGMERETSGSSTAEEAAWLPRYNLACEAMEAALGRAIAAPAPDLAAFAVKLELLFAHEAEPDSISDICVGAILADAGRLVAHQSGTLMGGRG
ncbi:MAG TPA: hypothetical protein VGD66_09180 [Allosphingosinicella sp.]|jgi:hypothetical protein